MAIQTDIIGPLKDTFSGAKEVFVLLPQNAGQEMVAAAAGLYGSLKTAGKAVTFACPTPISNSAKSVPGADEVTNAIGNRNLIISIKVDKRDSIDKVSYSLNEDEKTFNLVVQPKKGEAPLKKDTVSFAYSGAQADVIFIVGGNRFEDLGYFFETEPQLFTEAKTVAITRFSTTPYADFHINDSQAKGLAELTLELTQTLGLTPSADAATAFLVGIDTATGNLQNPSVGAETFERVAWLMRAGGVRQIAQAPAPTVKPLPTTAQVIPAATAQAVPQEWLAPKIYKGASDQAKV